MLDQTQIIETTTKQTEYPITYRHSKKSIHKVAVRQHEQMWQRLIIPVVDKFTATKIWDDYYRDDFKQDVLLVVLQKMKQQQGLSSAWVKAYARGVCQKMLLGYIRKKQLYCERHLDLSDNAEIDVSIDIDDTETSFERDRTKQNVSQALKSMRTERDSIVLREFYLYDKSPDLLASELEISIDHFYRVLHRAKSRLKNNMVAHG